MSRTTATVPWVRPDPRLATTITVRGGNRSEIAPPTSKNPSSGTMCAAATTPRSLARPEASSTAKANATGANELPSSDTARPVRNQRNALSRSGPSTGSMLGRPAALR